MIGIRVSVPSVVGVMLATEVASSAWPQSPPAGRMTFALAGDAIISQRLAPYDEPEFLELIQRIRDADLAFVNLEMLFHTYTEGYPAAHSGGTWMAAHPRLAHELTWAGFDMVSLANNHTMDWSAGGLRATSPPPGPARTSLRHGLPGTASHGAAAWHSFR